MLVSLTEYLLQINAISFEALLTDSEQIKFSGITFHYNQYS